ncbi:MAG: hypothetical protein WKI04_00055 [Ferruginibacter sp.]
MKKTVTSFMSLIAVAALITFSGCDKDHDGNNSEAVAGYLYTTTNGESVNKVVGFTRHKDGSLTDEKAYVTNSDGGADVSAGGDAHGDFDSQGGIQIIGNYLLNVNAGGNEVSVFALDRTNGKLTFKNNVGSCGTRPVSIAYKKNR